jgi:hypothetical protein
LRQIKQGAATLKVFSFQLSGVNNPEASELAELLKQSATTKSERMAKLTLDAIDNLQTTSEECGSWIARVVRTEGPAHGHQRYRQDQAD